MWFLLNYLGNALIILGLIFNIISLVGLIRIENIYNQLHICSVNDMFGVPLILLGSGLLMINQGMADQFLKIILLILTIYLINPLNTYALAKTAYFYNNKKH